MALGRAGVARGIIKTERNLKIQNDVTTSELKHKDKDRLTHIYILHVFSAATGVLSQASPWRGWGIWHRSVLYTFARVLGAAVPKNEPKPNATTAVLANGRSKQASVTPC